ncbi:MAG: thioredoxin [Solobacterium sp.]|nr:thioredoxin [Solobacterium sp.]
MNEITITSENFEAEVLKADKPVLLDFWASWCGPCKMLAPIVEEIANENTDIKVGKVNVDEQPQLAQQFGIMSIPTILVFKDGKVANQTVGYQPKENLLALVK